MAVGATPCAADDGILSAVGRGLDKAVESENAALGIKDGDAVHPREFAKKLTVGE